MFVITAANKGIMINYSLYYNPDIKSFWSAFKYNGLQCAFEMEYAQQNKYTDDMLKVNSLNTRVTHDEISMEELTGFSASLAGVEYSIYRIGTDKEILETALTLANESDGLKKSCLRTAEQCLSDFEKGELRYGVYSISHKSS